MLQDDEGKFGPFVDELNKQHEQVRSDYINGIIANLSQTYVFLMFKLIPSFFIIPLFLSLMPSLMLPVLFFISFPSLPHYLIITFTFYPKAFSPPQPLSLSSSFQALIPTSLSGFDKGCTNRMFVGLRLCGQQSSSQQSTRMIKILNPVSSNCCCYLPTK